jgi:tRNA pseudouridine32 synthase / 23S rRNA pseudouridine746 synthase
MIFVVPPSRIYLPKFQFPPATILEHLVSHFPQIRRDTWQERIARGLITTTDGDRVREDTPYRHGITVFYTKEVASEPEPAETETILYQDDEILAADKPHGMTVTPAGEHVARALLNRLQARTRIDTLVPLHRVDRDTAGIVLFGIRPESRGLYHDLFMKRIVEREYLAAATVSGSPPQNHWIIENRLGAGMPWFRRQIIAGPANAITEIELLETTGTGGLFRIKPHTGKKHQIRVHMASIGFPIVGDCLYPQMREQQPSDPPLQLLAWRLAFIDPITSLRREFRSRQQLRGVAV